MFKLPIFLLLRYSRGSLNTQQKHRYSYHSSVIKRVITFGYQLMNKPRLPPKSRFLYNMVMTIESSQNEVLIVWIVWIIRNVCNAITGSISVLDGRCADGLGLSDIDRDKAANTIFIA